MREFRRRVPGRRPRAAFWLAIVGLWGCGGEVIVTAGSDDGGGGEGAGGGGEGGTIANGGAAPACGRRDERFEMALYAFDASEWGCTIGTKTSEGTFATQGVVVHSDPVTITIDGCPPNTDCDAFLLTTVDFTAEGLENPVPEGAFVQIEAAVSSPMGCSHYLTVRNLPTWEDVPGPIPTSHVWMAAGDGALGTATSAGFGLEAEPLGCYPDDPAEDFELRFSSGSSAVTLAMGEEGELVIGGVTHHARNLRSFTSGAFDGGEAFGWWLTSPIDAQDF